LNLGVENGRTKRHAADFVEAKKLPASGVWVTLLDVPGNKDIA
jgi:hypothetical protein